MTSSFKRPALLLCSGLAALLAAEACGGDSKKAVDTHHDIGDGGAGAANGDDGGAAGKSMSAGGSGAKAGSSNADAGSGPEAGSAGEPNVAGGANVAGGDGTAGTTGTAGGAGTAGGSGTAGASAGGGGTAGGAGTAGGGGTAGSSGTPCTGTATTCASATQATVCGADGFLKTLDCTNGCADGACANSDLSTGWVLYPFVVPDDSPQITAAYSFTNNGLTALETQNSLPSIYYLDKVLQNVDITGTFGVHTTSDDDFIGFVFGYQDPQHFYLFDWKQAAQVDPTCGTADVGALLKLVNSASPLTTCNNFWNSAGTTGVTPLIAAANNPTPWADNTDYTFHLIYKPGDITISVHQGATLISTMHSTDTTYTSGKFGFYAYSQEQSQFNFVGFNPAP